MKNFPKKRAAIPREAAADRNSPADDSATSAPGRGRAEGSTLPLWNREKKEPSQYLPPPIDDTIKILEEALSRSPSSGGQQASMAEVAEGMGISLQEYLFMLEEVYPVRLFTVGPKPGKEAAARRLPWQEEPLSEGALLEAFFFDEVLVEVVARSIAALPEKERLVVSLCHKDRLSPEEVGLVLDLPESEVQQLHSQAMIRVRSGLYLKAMGIRYSA